MDDRIKIAMEIAYDAHAKQYRWNGEYYINHIQRVARATKEYCLRNGLKHVEEFEATAWLHDVIEDRPDKWDKIKLIDAGVYPSVALGVDLLTRTENQSYCVYIYAVKTYRLARVAKINDILDNIITSNPLYQERYSKSLAALCAKEREMYDRDSLVRK